MPLKFDRTQARLTEKRHLEILMRQFRNAQRKGISHAERSLNVALDSWTRINDRLVLEPYDWEESGHATPQA